MANTSDPTSPTEGYEEFIGHVAQRLPFALHQKIGLHPDTINVSFSEHFMREVSVRIEMDLFGGTKETEKQVYFYYAHPANWWEMFKQSYFPQWLLGRFPVRQKEIRESKTVKFVETEIFKDLSMEDKQRWKFTRLSNSFYES